MTVHNRQLLHDFTVQGTGPFPLDMLRFDECWPQGGDDAAEMEQPAHPTWSPAGKRRRTVRLRSIKAPTPARWSSFGWLVVNEED